MRQKERFKVYVGSGALQSCLFSTVKASKASYKKVCIHSGKWACGLIAPSTPFSLSVVFFHLNSNRVKLLLKRSYLHGNSKITNSHIMIIIINHLCIIIISIAVHRHVYCFKDLEII